MSTESTRPISEAMLSEWFMARIDFSSHSEFVLCGIAWGHQLLRSGDPTTTSSVLELSSDDSWARTRNTLYWLRDAAEKGKLDRNWKTRLLLAAEANLKGQITLRGVELYAHWPYTRSSSVKFQKPTLN